MNPTTIIPVSASLALLGPASSDVDEAVLHEFASGLRADGYGVASAWDLTRSSAWLDGYRALLDAVIEADAVVAAPGWLWDDDSVALVQHAATIGRPVVEFDPAIPAFVPVQVAPLVA